MNLILIVDALHLRPLAASNRRNASILLLLFHAAYDIHMDDDLILVVPITPTLPRH